MFQFPFNPVVGQLFNPVAGVTYRWNGTAWFLTAGPGAFITQAEADLRYLQPAQADARYFPDGYLYRLTLSNNVVDAVNDIDIATGNAVNSTNAAMMRLAAGLTKRLDAGWVAGTNQGMRNSAAAIADTTYHIYLVATAAAAVVDVYAHTSAVPATVLAALQAEPGGAGYLYVRRIGSIMRVAGIIILFNQKGNLFQRMVPVQASTANNPGTAAALMLAGTPLGVKFEAQLSVFTQFDRNVATQAMALVTDPDTTDTAASLTLATNGVVDANGPAAPSTESVTSTRSVFTNISGQVRTRFSFSNAASIITLNNFGWIDRRDRDG